MWEIRVFGGAVAGFNDPLRMGASPSLSPNNRLLHPKHFFFYYMFIPQFTTTAAAAERLFATPDFRL